MHTGRPLLLFGHRDPSNAEDFTSPCFFGASIQARGAWIGASKIEIPKTALQFFLSPWGNWSIIQQPVPSLSGLLDHFCSSMGAALISLYCRRPVIFVDQNSISDQSAIYLISNAKCSAVSNSNQSCFESQRCPWPCFYTIVSKVSGHPAKSHQNLPTLSVIISIIL